MRISDWSSDVCSSDLDLVAPDGSVYKLHNRSGGSSNDIHKTYTDDLSGESLNGTWNLRVKDSGRGDTGTLNSSSVLLSPHRTPTRPGNGPGRQHGRRGQAAAGHGPRPTGSPQTGEDRNRAADRQSVSGRVNNGG